MGDDGAQTPLLPDLTQISRRGALREIHFPPTNEALARAREALVLAEFFAMQMLLASRRAAPERDRAGSTAAGRIARALFARPAF